MRKLIGFFKGFIVAILAVLAAWGCVVTWLASKTRMLDKAKNWESVSSDFEFNTTVKKKVKE